MAPGTRLGSCEVLLAIARGGMAQVWAARQHGARGFNRLVAVKTVLPELADPEFEEMFLEEARLAARIHHPNVCEIFELVEAGGVLALAMEWIHGDTLNALLEASRTRLDRRISAQIVAQVASGLHAAHELRDECGVPLHIVHRDVSPHNVLISRDGHVKVTDFGVAKAIGGAREETLAGQIKGKPAYLSPEQARCEPLDRRSDIFSLGVLLYVATVNSHPFRRPGQSRREQILNLVTNHLTPPSAVARDYPKGLEAIVLKALQHDPKDRFSTADEMRSELCDWIMKTGALVTERDISQALLEHLGPSIEERGERLAQALLVSRERQGMRTGDLVLAGEALASAPARPALVRLNPAVLEPQLVELTFTPTSRGAARWGGTRARLRLALWVSAALSCAGVGALGFYRAAMRQTPIPSDRSLAASEGPPLSAAAQGGGACSEPACTDARSGLRLADLRMADESGARLPRGGPAPEEPAQTVAGLANASVFASQRSSRSSAEPVASDHAAASEPARAAPQRASRPGEELRHTGARRAPDSVRIGPRETEL
ncbi:MAG: serine/threonine-protein kinase [Deltaproteobacteria bacterium]